MPKLLALLTMFSLMAPVAADPATTATLTIVDEEGAAIEDARVRVSDAEHPLGIEAASDDDGHAMLENLPAGTLHLKITADGFRKRHLVLTSDLIADGFTVRLRRRKSTTNPDGSG